MLGWLYYFHSRLGKKCWFKTGIEYCKGLVWLSTVVADKGADRILLLFDKLGGNTQNGKSEIVIEYGLIDGVTEIWIIGQSQVGMVDEKPIRELPWGLCDTTDERIVAVCYVGCYTARLGAEANGVAEADKALVVDFRDFELEVKEQ